MSPASTVTAVGQVNLDTLLPVYHRPQRAQTFPMLDPHPSNNRTMLSRAHATASGVRTWFTSIEEHIGFIGVAIAIVTLIVTIVGIVVAAVITVAVK